MEREYIKILNDLRFARNVDTEKIRELLMLRDVYEVALKISGRATALVNPHVKCVRSRDTELMKELVERRAKPMPEIDFEGFDELFSRVSDDYEALLSDISMSRTKKGEYCVYMRVHRDTGNFYVGHSNKTALFVEITPKFFMSGMT